MAGEARERRRPVGTVAAATFLLGVLVLFLLLFRGDDDAAAPVPLDDGDFDVESFESRVDERLDPVALRPVAALRIRLRSVVWRDAGGRRFLETPSAAFVLDLPGPGGGGLRISNGVIEQPVVRLVRSAEGRWNFERSLAPLLNGNGPERGRGPGGMAVVLSDIVVRGGAVSVDLPGTRFAARSLDLRLASARLSGPGVDAPTFTLASADAVLELPDTAGGTVTREVSLADASVRVLDGAVAFDVDRATFGTSTFADASGVWNPALGGLGLDAELRAERFQLADVPWLRADVPAEAVGSFVVRIEPAAGDRTAVALSSLTVTAPGTSASGSLRILFGETGFALESIDMRVDPLALSLVEAFTGPLPYTGDLRGTIQGTGGRIGFELTARLATTPAAEPFTTELSGAVAFTPAGLDLDQVTIGLDQVPLSALEPVAPGLPLAGPVSGTVTLTGMPTEEPIQLDVRLEAGGGIARVAGVLDLTGAVPAYDVGGLLVGVELRSVLEPAMPPAQLHGSFDLEGSGTSLETATAAIRLDGTFTGWRAERGDTISLDARLAGGRLNVSSGRLELGPISLVAEGEWALVGGGGGAIRYALAVSSLEPLAPYLPPDEVGRARFARGSLQARGSIAGTLEAPVLAGTVEAENFRFGEWAAQDLQGEYTANLRPGGLPAIEAEIAGTDIQTPTGDFESFDLDVDFTRPDFSLALNADQVGGGVLQLEAGGRIEDAGGREVRLTTVELDLEDQRWRLPSPARIAWVAGDAVRVEDLRLQQTDGDGVLRLEGIVAPFDEADFALEVRQLPIGNVLELVGQDFQIAGDLSLEGRIQGPADAPQLTLDARLEEGTIRDVRVRSADALIRYDDGALTIEGAGIFGDSAWVELEGIIPARLALGAPPSIELIDGRELSGRLVTDDFPLATLDPGIRSVQDLEGLLRADVRIAGTPDEPRLTGDIELVDGEVTVPLLDKRYTGIAGIADLSGREVRVRRLVAESGGTATVEGVITLEDLDAPAFDLTARLDGFQPQGVDNANDASAFGTVRLSGSLADPVLTGDVRMDDGTVSLAPFTRGPALGERLVGVAESFAPIATGELDIPGSGQPPIRVEDFELEAGSDLWFATDEARAQLQGTLLLQTVANDLTIRGDLTGQQGSFALRVGPVTRRFDVVDANIRFQGSPDPNPGLDITASRRVPMLEGGMVDVRVRVTGTLNRPRIALESAEGMAVAESELLSLVLFGRPTFTAGDAPLFGGQANVLTETLAFTGAFDALSAGLASVDVLEELDHFQIQMRGAMDGSEAPMLWLIMGEQFDIGTEDVLVTVETPLQGWDLLIAAAEWRIDREWTLELSWEPESYLGATGTGRMPVPLSELTTDQQVLLVIRRRWTY